MHAKTRKKYTGPAPTFFNASGKPHFIFARFFASRNARAALCNTSRLLPPVHKNRRTKRKATLHYGTCVVFQKNKWGRGYVVAVQQRTWVCSIRFTVLTNSVQLLQYIYGKEYITWSASCRQRPSSVVFFPTPWGKRLAAIRTCTKWPLLHNHVVKSSVSPDIQRITHWTEKTGNICPDICAYNMIKIVLGPGHFQCFFIEI